MSTILSLLKGDSLYIYMVVTYAARRAILSPTQYSTVVIYGWNQLIVVGLTTKCTVKFVWCFRTGEVKPEQQLVRR